MNLRGALYFICLIFLASCGSSKKVATKEKNKSPHLVVLEEDEVNFLLSYPGAKQTTTTKSETPNTTSKEDLVNKINKKVSKVDKPIVTKKLNNKDNSILEYIQKYAAVAVSEMNTHNIPASITLAQGILESGNGNGDLAKRSNNHFGIKCHSEWKGERVYHDDDKAKECFRKYKYVETSFNDHSEFLTKRQRYAFLFEYDTKDYKSWAKGLRKAGYATDVKYPEKLISIIERYKLYELDSVNTTGIKYANKKRNTQVQIANQKPKKKGNKIVIDGDGTTYKVKDRDTLYSIARAAKISVDKLKTLNDLKDNTIVVGQILKVK